MLLHHVNPARFKPFGRHGNHDASRLRLIDMVHQPQARASELLRQLQDGDRSVLDELFALVYDELRSIARVQRKAWERDYTLNTTGLVHEAYLKLVEQSSDDWESRSHFTAVAAKAMRHILVDYARRRKAEKRGGKVKKQSLHEIEYRLEQSLQMSEYQSDEVLALDQALQKLAQMDERAARVVECKFFGAMTIEETADALGLSQRTVIRDWAMAQAWLRKEIEADPPP